MDSLCKGFESLPLVQERENQIVGRNDFLSAFRKTTNVRIFKFYFQRASAAIQLANPKSEVARRGQALQLNINAALGLQDVLKTNLGPKGTIKMYFLSSK